jgi:hypothetical protein
MRRITTIITTTVRKRTEPVIAVAGRVGENAE